MSLHALQVVTEVVFNNAVISRKALPTDPDNAFPLVKLAMAGNSLYMQVSWRGG